MDQAQGSIDAARAAGADRFATEQYGAAVKALQNAQDAVALRDYRLALNYALDARDRAQRAPRSPRRRHPCKKRARAFRKAITA
jgi:hypothetical protein